MIVERIDYINEEADLKPTCYRCGYSMTPVWTIKDTDEEIEEVCKNCLTEEELEELKEFNYENSGNR